MKQTILISLLFLFAQDTSGQAHELSADSISAYFKEIESAAKAHYDLWRQDLYGPILLVDPQTRKAFANEPDTAGVLKPYENIYAGTLPPGFNAANAAINWGGKRWAMIMLPLPGNRQKRINLLAHELFHKAQPSLGFTFLNVSSNNHLDQEEGRVYLRLELEALKKAVHASSEKEKRQHLASALTFRKYRHSFYPGSDTAENTLELNEGLAEFTGAMISGRSEKQMAEHFASSIDNFFSNSTFVRSFAYETIPVYGYLLYGYDENWTRNVEVNTNLTAYFIEAFDISLPVNLKKTAESLSGSYNGQVILASEKARAEKNKKLIAGYTKKLILQPHFEIPIEIELEKLSVSFDPRTVMPMGDNGTVYPRIRVTDLWGTLIVENGALISPGWTRISITNPTETEGKKISGDGWTLELADGYTLEKDEASDTYTLVNKVAN